MGFRAGNMSKFYMRFGSNTVGLLGAALLASCAAHASQSFAEREAKLNQRSDLKSYEVEPQKTGNKLAQAQPSSQKADAPIAPKPAKEAPVSETEPVSTEEFVKPQNPQAKRLKAALTCGKLVLKKGGRAKCHGPVRMWREDVEITCTFAWALFNQKGALSELKCEGDVRIVTSERVGFAQRAIYDENKQNITLEEEAKLKQRGMQLQGEKVVVDLLTEEVTVEGGVKGLYAPEEPKADD